MVNDTIYGTSGINHKTISRSYGTSERIYRLMIETSPGPAMPFRGKGSLGKSNGFGTEVR